MKSVLERNLGFMGYPTYSVDTEGNVWSYPKKTYSGIRKLKACVDGYGYKQVFLSNVNYKYKMWKVHRLVALAFIPNTDNKPQIDHINGDKTNNSVKNLRWVTCKENINNPLTKRYGERHPFYGKHHSDKSKRLMSIKKKGKGLNNEDRFG